jgi:hypothetical protein
VCWLHENVMCSKVLASLCALLHPSKWRTLLLRCNTQREPGLAEGSNNACTQYVLQAPANCCCWLPAVNCISSLIFCQPLTSTGNELSQLLRLLLFLLLLLLQGAPCRKVLHRTVSPQATAQAG